ncbi:hypothetical protein [Singulisphaera sp. PoT]|uniref:hypothetical protein n=1 Tax=Singulisphaera sp. PoT TaxID=3411797 RepID=UPI003BF52157
MHILLENGPFGGCTLRLDGSDCVPRMMWFNRAGELTDATTDRDEGLSRWMGRVVEPVPHLELEGIWEPCTEFGYERTSEPEEGFDVVFRFADTLSWVPGDKPASGGLPE